jgi:hypothetical protein
MWWSQAPPACDVTSPYRLLCLVTERLSGESVETCLENMWLSVNGVLSWTALIASVRDLKIMAGPWWLLRQERGKHNGWNEGEIGKWFTCREIMCYKGIIKCQQVMYWLIQMWVSFSDLLVITLIIGAHSSVVDWGTMLQGGRSLVLVLDEVDFFNLPNPSSRTVALGSTQPLTEMSTRSLPGGKKQPACRADNLSTISEPSV